MHRGGHKIKEEPKSYMQSSNSLSPMVQGIVKTWGSLHFSRHLNSCVCIWFMEVAICPSSACKSLMDAFILCWSWRMLTCIKLIISYKWMIRICFYIVLLRGLVCSGLLVLLVARGISPSQIWMVFQVIVWMTLIIINILLHRPEGYQQCHLLAKLNMHL